MEGSVDGAVSREPIATWVSNTVANARTGVRAGPLAEQEAKRRGGNGSKNASFQIRKASKSHVFYSPCRASAG